MRWLGYSLGLLLLCICSNVQAAFSFDPALHWYTLQSEHFEIHYHDGEEAVAKRAAEIGEKQYKRLTAYYEWEPWQKTQLVLVNTLDITNAFATPFPVNTMTLFLPPPDTPNEDYDDWLEHLITHEFTHIIQLDKVRNYRSFRKIFGRFPLFFPNIFQPTWVLEGMATYQETQAGDRIGRGQSSYYRSLMKIEWQHGLKGLRQVNLPIVSWPMGRTRYLYGVYFFNFLHARYGEDKIKQWVDAYSNNLVPWSVDSVSHRVFQKSMFVLWDEFNQYLTEQFQPQQDAILAEGSSKALALSHSGYYTGNLQRGPGPTFYYVKNDLLSQASLMRFTPGEPAQEVMEIHGSSFDVSKHGVVYVQREFNRNTNFFGEIYVADSNGKHERQITEAGRYTQVRWLGDNIVAIQQDGVSQKIQLLDQQGKRLRTIWQGKPGVVVSTPAISPDQKRLLASVWRPDSHWNIEALTLESGSWQPLTQRDGDEANPRFSQDGQSIYFIADYDHRTFNIYKMDLSGANLRRLSNDSNGITEVEETADGDLLYVGMNSQGSDIYQLKEVKSFPTHTAALAVKPETEPVTQARSIDAAAAPQNFVIEDYSALHRLTPKYWFPVWNLEPGRSDIGFSTSMSDPLLRHSYDLVALYDTKNKWFSGQLGYLYDRYLPAMNVYVNRLVDVVRNNNDDILAWYAEQQAAVQWMFPYLKRDYQFRFDVGLLHEETKLLKTDVNITVLDDDIDLASFALRFNTSKQFARSIQPAQGHNVNLVREKYFKDSKNYKPATSLEWRYYYTLSGNHSLAARVLRAKSDQADPYRFGGSFSGFGLPLSFATTSSGYASMHQRKYALRGYKSGLPQLIGSDAALANIEYRFPIAQLETGWTAPPLGLNRIHGSVFYSAANPNHGFSTEDVYRSTGLELQFEVIIGYFIPINTRLGYAYGFDAGGENIYYVQVGGSF